MCKEIITLGHIEVEKQNLATQSTTSITAAGIYY